MTREWEEDNLVIYYPVLYQAGFEQYFTLSFSGSNLYSESRLL
jgi:hypothetical protein